LFFPDSKFVMEVQAPLSSMLLEKETDKSQKVSQVRPLLGGLLVPCNIHHTLDINIQIYEYM
jgi:hypothetical protein